MDLVLSRLGPWAIAVILAAAPGASAAALAAADGCDPAASCACDAGAETSDSGHAAESALEMSRGPTSPDVEAGAASSSCAQDCDRGCESVGSDAGDEDPCPAVCTACGCSAAVVTTGVLPSVRTAPVSELRREHRRVESGDPPPVELARVFRPPRG